MPENQTPKNPSQHVTTAKSQATTEINTVNSNEKKTQLKITQIVLAITTTNSGQAHSNPNNNNNATNTNTNNANNRNDNKPRTVYPPCETRGKINHKCNSLTWSDGGGGRVEDPHVLG